MSEWQGFYSTTQVSRLAGIPVRTLYDWKSRGIIEPSVQVIEDDTVIDEGYSYADLAIAKLLRALRNKQLSLKSVVKSLRHLYDRFGSPASPEWINAHVYVIGKEVFAQKPDGWDTTLASKYGQRAEMRVLGELFEEEASILIPDNYNAFIEINLNVMGGEPVVRDTRVPTYILAMMYDQGTSVRELAKLYKPIPKIAIEKAIEFEKNLDQTLQNKPAKTEPIAS